MGIHSHSHCLIPITMLLFPFPFPWYSRSDSYSHGNPMGSQSVPFPCTPLLTSQRASPPFGQYQIILLGNRRTYEWTTCPGSLHQSRMRIHRLKPGIHYPSWRPESTARVDGWPVSITHQHGLSTQLVETRARHHGPCWRVMETGHPSTRAVNSGHQLE